MNDSITQEEHSILGLKWEDGLPFGLFLNLRNDYYEKVNLVNLRLSYKYHTILVTIPFNRKINTIHDLTDNIKYLFNTYK